MRKKKLRRERAFSIAWHVRHVIDVIYHWILKHVFRKYPVTCSCYPTSKLGFNWPTKKNNYNKRKPNQICMVEVDEDNTLLILESDKKESEILEEHKRAWRSSLLNTANNYRASK